MTKSASSSNSTEAENEALMIQYSKELTKAPQELIDEARQVFQGFNGTLFEEMTQKEIINTGFLYVQGVISNKVVQNWGNWYECWQAQYAGRDDGLGDAIKDGKDPVFEFFKVTNDANHYMRGKPMNITDIVSYNQLDFGDVVKATKMFLPDGYDLGAKNSTNCTTLESIYPGFNPLEIKTYEELSKVMVKKVGELLQRCYEEDSIMRGSSWPISVDSLLFLNKAARDILFPWVGTPQGQEFFLNNTHVQEYLSSSKQSYWNGDFLTAENDPLCENMTVSPTGLPSSVPSSLPSNAPTESPIPGPTVLPTLAPSSSPSNAPSLAPTEKTTQEPSALTAQPTQEPSALTAQPTPVATEQNTPRPTGIRSSRPNSQPTYLPSSVPTLQDSRHTALRGGGFEDRLGEGFGAASGLVIVAFIIGFLLKKFHVATRASDNRNLIQEGLPEFEMVNSIGADELSQRNLTQENMTVPPYGLVISDIPSGSDYNMKTDPSFTGLAAESSIIVTSAAQSSSPSTNIDEAVNPILKESSNLEEGTSPTTPKAKLKASSAIGVAPPSRLQGRFEE
jgi:hypothetical protein